MSDATFISTWPDFVQYHFKAYEKDAYASIKKTYDASVVRYSDRPGCSVAVTERLHGEPRDFCEYKFRKCPETWRAAEKLAAEAIERFKTGIRK